MAQKTDIRLRRSDTAGKIPTSANLSDGELAINTSSGALYFKKSDGTIITVHDNTILHIDSDTTVSSTTGTNPKVGIGTTSPSEVLHIYGSSNTVKTLIENTSTSTSAYATLGFQSDLGHSVNPGLFLTGSNNTNYAGANSLNMYQFGNLPLGFVTNNSLKMIIEGGGNVGIGTSNPDKLLVVEGASAEIVINDTDTTDTPTLRFRESGSTSGIIQTDASNMIFKYGTTEAMRIDASGHLGIGTTSPSVDLHIKPVTGNGNLYVERTSGALVFLQAQASAGAIGVGSNHRLDLKTNGTTRLSIAAGGAITFNTAFTFPTTDGTSGQVLKTNGSGTITWADETGGGSAATSITDADLDTKIQVEENADEDVIRFDVAGSEIATITDDGVILNDGYNFEGDVVGAIKFKAQAGEALTKGDVVYISGISGNTTVVSKADADDSSKMPAFGVAASTVSLNAAVEIVTFGTLLGVDTSTPNYSEGDELYVSTTAGAMTNSAPTGSGSLLQKIAKVTRVDASAGSIKVSGAGRTNATPNLDEGRLFVGNSSNQSVQGDDTLYVDMTNSRVGINTTSPSFPLHVATDGNTIAKYETSLTSDLAIQLTNSQGSMFFGLGGGEEFAVATDGDLNGSNNLFVIKQTGNVGIGTTSPAGNLHIKSKSNVGDALLIVEADADNNVESDNPRIELRQDGNLVSGALYLEGNAGTTATNALQNSLLLDAKGASNDGGTIQFATGGLAANQSGGPTNSAVRMTILRDGNVGIGTTTPSDKLEVNGNVRIETSSGNSGFKVITSSTAEGFLIFGDSDDNSMGGIAYNNSTNSLSIDCNNAERISINSSGDVGIGTTSPVSRLHVIENVNNSSALQTEGTTADAATIRIENDNTTVGSYASLFLRADTADARIAVIKKSSTSNDADIVFMVNDASASTNNEKLRIVGESGNVGIGTDSPSDLLHVAGAIRTHTSSTSKYLRMFGGGSGNFIDSYGATLYIRPDGSTANGTYMDQSGNIVTAADFTVGGNTVITGNLTVNGTTVTNSATNTTIEDALIELGSGNTGANSNDLGLILERGTTGDNIFMGWDESADRVVFGTTTADGASTGDITYSSANIGAHNVYSAGSLVLTSTSGQVVINSKTAISASGNFLYINGSNDFTSGVYINSNVRVDGGLIGSYNEDLQLRTGTTTRIQVSNSSGNVGIGTNSLTERLNVVGDLPLIKIGNSNATYRYAGLSLETLAGPWYISSGSSKTTSNSDLYISRATDGTDHRFKFGRDDYALSIYDNADAVKVYLHADGNSYFNGGSLGIGTSSPSDLLHIHATGTNKSALIVEDDARRLEMGRDQIQAKSADGSTIQNLYIQPDGTTSFASTSGTVAIGNTGSINGAKLYVKNGSSGQTFSNISGVLIDVNGTSNSYYGLRVASSTGNSHLTVTNAGNVGIGIASPASKFQIEEYGIDTTETSTTATTQVAIHTFAATAFRSARFTIQVTNSTDSTYHTTEILLVHDGTDVYITEFGEIHTGVAEEATFDADINTGNVRLLATPASTDAMEFKVVCHSVTV